MLDVAGVVALALATYTLVSMLPDILRYIKMKM